MKFLLILISFIYVHASITYTDDFYAKTKPGKYIDFGVQGKLYDIKEENFETAIMEGLKDLNLTKKDFELALDKSIKKISKHKSYLPVCHKDTFKSEVDGITLKSNMTNPLGRVFKKRGDFIKSPKLPIGSEFNVFMLEGSNKISLINQIRFYSKIDNDALILISNTSILEYRDMFPKSKIYPSSSQYEDRFNVNCLPVQLHFKSDIIERKYKSYEYFKTED